MDEILSDIRSLAKDENFWGKLRLPEENGSYHVDEESDLYGFSCMSASHMSSKVLSKITASSSSSRSKSPKRSRSRDHDIEQCNSSSGSGGDGIVASHSILDIFRSDENWNNPAAVDLMMKAYDLDKNPHLSIAISEIARGDRPPVESFNFLEVKSSQYRMLAGKKIDEAMIALQKSQIAIGIQLLTDAIKLDKDNVNSFFLRAKSYMALKDFNHAHQDIMSALELTPDTIELIELRDEIERNMDGLANSRRGSRMDINVGSNSKLRLTQASVHQTGQFSETHDFVSDTNSNVIAKLRSSLGNVRDNEDSATNSSSSSSESESNESEDDSSSRSSDHRKSKRRRKSSNSSKHSKHKKKDKKRHKDKKKSKRKSKKKSRSDD